MSLLKKIVFGLAGLIVLLVLVGLVLPGAYRVERSVVIDAPMIRVYPLVYSPPDWIKWGVWIRRDPAMKTTYSGPPAGVGAKWSWQSATQGNGSMEITQAVFDKTIAYTLSIEGWDGKFLGHLDFAPAPGAKGPGVKVTWVGEGDVGMNLIGRYFVLFMDRMLGPDFEACLKNLKDVAERGG